VERAESRGTLIVGDEETRPATEEEIRAYPRPSIWSEELVEDHLIKALRR
jgi:hypothetical protein